MAPLPDRHALLGPSSAHMWLACPPSARLGEQYPDTESDYTREGTLAHRLAELRLREQWEGLDIAQQLKEVEASPFYNNAMAEHVADYVDFIAERMADAKTRCPDPKLYIETEVHYEDYVPDGFGTSDACIIADGVMDVVDFKYGAGVPVEAEGNSQMRLYGLGQYLELYWAYKIDVVRMTIFQPRLGRISTDTISSRRLLAWAENELKPVAALAWAGGGEFHPGEDQCRWCKAAALCRARAEYQLELAKYDFADPATLSWEDVGKVLARISDLTKWAEQVQAYAQSAAITHGQVIPGWKLVQGRSNRKYADEPAIAAALRKAGYKAGEIYKPKALLGLTAMEKLVGAKKLNQLAGQYIIKPEGAPVLVPESDKRPAINTAAQAAEDFKEDLT